MHDSKCYPHQRLISRFRCGCHGQHFDTGRFGKGMEQLNREERVCHACLSHSVEDEHYYLLDCSAYSQICAEYDHLFQHPFHQQWQSSLLLNNPMY